MRVIRIMIEQDIEVIVLVILIAMSVMNRKILLGLILFVLLIIYLWYKLFKELKLDEISIQYTLDFKNILLYELSNSMNKQRRHYSHSYNALYEKFLLHGFSISWTFRFYVEIITSLIISNTYTCIISINFMNDQ